MSSGARRTLLCRSSLPYAELSDPALRLQWSEPGGWTGWASMIDWMTGSLGDKDHGTAQNLDPHRRHERRHGWSSSYQAGGRCPRRHLQAVRRRKSSLSGAFICLLPFAFVSRGEMELDRCAHSGSSRSLALSYSTRFVARASVGFGPPSGPISKSTWRWRTAGSRPSMKCSRAVQVNGAQADVEIEKPLARSSDV